MAEGKYSQQEALDKLALTEDQLGNLVREGRLREFQADGQAQYDAGEVDELAAEINPQFDASSDISASGMDSDSVIDLQQSSLDGGEESAVELQAADTTDGGTDVVSLEDSGIGEQGTVAKAGDDTVVTPTGVSVFDEDELAGFDADPMAKTQIAPSVGGELSLEGGGGSGLLDLTRESDDTSLGAELLDEIYDGAETMPSGGQAPSEEAEEFEEKVEEPASAAPVAGGYAAVEVIDPHSGMFTGILIAAFILMGFAGMVCAGLAISVLPRFVAAIGQNILFWPIGAVVGLIIFLVVGLFIGKSRQ